MAISIKSEADVAGMRIAGRLAAEVLDVLKPEVKRTLPKSCQVFPFDVFMHYKPPYVMLAMCFVHEQPKDFLDCYELVASPDPLNVLLLFKLKDAGVNKAVPAAATREVGR
jgi:hypothetical protein